jgi:hypothetical protein
MSEQGYDEVEDDGTVKKMRDAWWITKRDRDTNAISCINSRQDVF